MPQMGRISLLPKEIEALLMVVVNADPALKGLGDEQKTDLVQNTVRQLLDARVNLTSENIYDPRTLMQLNLALTIAAAVFLKPLKPNTAAALRDVFEPLFCLGKTKDLEEVRNIHESLRDAISQLLDPDEHAKERLVGVINQLKETCVTDNLGNVFYYTIGIVTSHPAQAGIDFTEAAVAAMADLIDQAEKTQEIPADGGQYGGKITREMLEKICHMAPGLVPPG